MSATQENDLRKSIASIALIRKEDQGQTLWLVQWNENSKLYNFVGGHKRPDETFRECLIREITEELALEEGRKCQVTEEPLAHLEYIARSESAKQDTEYTMEVFEVDLIGDEACQTIDEAGRNDDGLPINRWLRREEIQADQFRDQQLVSATVERILSAVSRQR